MSFLGGARSVRDVAVCAAQVIYREASAHQPRRSQQGVAPQERDALIQNSVHRQRDHGQSEHTQVYKSDTHVTDTSLTRSLLTKEQSKYVKHQIEFRNKAQEITV